MLFFNNKSQMYRAIIILFFLSYLANLTGQSNYQVVYNCNSTVMISGQINGPCNLLFNSSKSVFTFSSWPEKSEYQDSGGQVMYVMGDVEKMPVFTDLENQQQWLKIDYLAPRRPFIFRDSIPTINWEIKDEIRKIGDFNATMAQGIFGGRMYEAWFTQEIPVPFGPYRMGGLPGLILAVRSLDGQVSFTFKEFRPVESAVITPPVYGLLTTPEEYQSYVIDRLLKAESTSTAEYQVTNNDPPENYYIEKKRITINSDFKRARGY